MHFFVTSSGTGIGKTFVTSVLIRQARAAHKTIMAYKPVISGFDAANPAASDTGMLLEAMELPLTPDNIDTISPHRFIAPLSPHAAAEREGQAISLEALTQPCSITADITLIEGVGGVMVPLNNKETVLDWIKALGHPAILVAGSYVGSLSHSLTAVEILKQAGVSAQAIIVSESPESAMPLAETVATLRQFLPDIRHIVALPRVKSWHDAPDLLHILA